MRTERSGRKPKRGSRVSKVSKVSNRTRRPIRLLVADDEGRFYDHPDLLLAGRSWDRSIPVAGRRSTIAAPDGLQMVFLPGRRPVGIDPRDGLAREVTDFEVDGRQFVPHAVAAVLPPGHLRHLAPAAAASRIAPALPLRSYTAVGLRGDALRVAASRLDLNTHWDPARFRAPDLEERIDRLRSRFPVNPVVDQLAHCARDYSCCTALNIFLGTYEGALPCAPNCNANCLGCISDQDGPAVSPQSRLITPPTAEHLVQVAAHHLDSASPGMVSFGQGCEGEPLSETDRIVTAIKGIRDRTDRGTIHLNTNGSRPDVVEALVVAGLQSVRVSLFSARPDCFAAYHRGDFGLESVERFIATSVNEGLFTSLNLLTFPGFTDRPDEVEALEGLLDRTGAHMVQMRNLDLDPDRIVTQIPPAEGEPLGLPALVRRLRRDRQNLDLGSFNRFPGDWPWNRRP